MKQPWEDVAPGKERDDAWLSLDVAALSTRGLLVAAAHHLYTAVLVGNPAPIVKRMCDRVTQPQPGDVVVEMTVIFSRRPPEDQVRVCGYLVERREEWWDTDEEWEKVRDQYEPYGQGRPVDTAWYVQYGPAAADVCRWTDCRFVALVGEDERWL